MAKKNDEIKFEIRQQMVVLSERKNGWRKELNRVSWNGADPKWDIREWNEEHDKMSKGITLTEEEAHKVYELFKKVMC